MDLQEFEQKFRDLFGRGIEDVKADLAKADAFAVEHAPALEKVLGSVVGALKLVAPGVGTEASAVVSDAEKGFTELQALYEKYFGTKVG
jgi:hypothetical protein